MPVISIGLLPFTTSGPRNAQRFYPYTMLSLKPREPHTSKQRLSRTKLSSFGMQARVLRKPRNINRTERSTPAGATTLTELPEVLSLILASELREILLRTLWV